MFTFALLLAVATPDAQAGDNLFGGRAVEKRQGYFEVGYPHVEGGVRFRLGKHLELTPKLRTAYADGLSIPVVTISPGIDFRVPVLDRAKVDAALTFSLPFHARVGPGRGRPFDLPDDPRANFGIGLGHPGFALTFAVTDEVDLDAGFRFENDLYVLGDDDPTLRANVPVRFGVEVEVDSVQLGFLVEGGPSITAWEDQVRVGAMVRSMFAAGFSF